jgi:uncharacterized protein YggE
MSEIKQRYWTFPLAIVAVALLAANVALMVPLYTGAAPVTYLRGDGSNVLLGIGESNGQQGNTISLSGTGTVTVTPDQVQVRLGVETRASTASEAQQMNAEKMSNVIETLKEAGVPEEKIKTSGFSLTPVTAKTEEPWRSDLEYEVVGYICSNNVVFTVDEISTAGDIIDLAVTAGANTVQGVYFTVSDEKAAELQNQATQMAVKDAEAKAKLIAETAGVTIVGPTSLSIGGFYMPEYRAYDAVASAPASNTPILPGQIDVSVTVQAIYTFE